MAKPLHLLVSALVLALTCASLARARDPDIPKDYLVPPGIDPSGITGHYFTYTGFRHLRDVNLTGRTSAFLKEVTMKEFPALEGQSISVAAIMFPPGGINTLHTHPRSAELLLVIEGVLEVGFIDENNKLFVQTLAPSDMFIFPEGLVHYQVNTLSNSGAFALAIFGSSNGGLIPLPGTIFGSGINPAVLAKAFSTDSRTISKLIAGQSSGHR